MKGKFGVGVTTAITTTTTTTTTTTGGDGGGGGACTTPTTTVNVSMREYRFDLDKTSVPAGCIQFVIKNVGEVHNFDLQGKQAVRSWCRGRRRRGPCSSPPAAMQLRLRRAVPHQSSACSARSPSPESDACVPGGAPSASPGISARRLHDPQRRSRLQREVDEMRVGVDRDDVRLGREQILSEFPQLAPALLRRRRRRRSPRRRRAGAAPGRRRARPGCSPTSAVPMTFIVRRSSVSSLAFPSHATKASRRGASTCSPWSWSQPGSDDTADDAVRARVDHRDLVARLDVREDMLRDGVVLHVAGLSAEVDRADPVSAPR